MKHSNRVALRFVAPAGAPIPLSAFGPWSAAWARRQDHAALLQSAMEAEVGVRFCKVLNTGRAGMTVLLRALRTLSPSRDEVIIPSYTCYSVAAAVVKAGLVPRLADINPDTLDFDHERLQAADFRRVLAVVATNLYGMPNDLPGLTAIAHERGAFVVDDAAQSLGARLDGRLCGTLGDAGLYSFDKGKNVSAIDGGAIVTDDPRIAEAVSAETARLPRASAGDITQALIKLAAYALLLPPRLYWIPNSIPLLGLGRTVYSTAYPIAQQPSALAALALTMLPRLQEYTAKRRSNAEAMLASLRGVTGLRPITPLPAAEPAYVRLAILLDRPQARDSAVDALNHAGIGATRSYPGSIADIAELRGSWRGDERDAAGGRAVASRILTLPTHPYVTRADTNRAADVIHGVLQSRPPVSVGRSAAAAKASSL